ncbi:MAG TPA: hypothetical protein ENG54_02945 [Thermofilum sp.]|nr:hypothetical protein [Thermofilum sp.]
MLELLAVALTSLATILSTIAPVILKNRSEKVRIKFLKYSQPVIVTALLANIYLLAVLLSFKILLCLATTVIDVFLLWVIIYHYWTEKE